MSLRHVVRQGEGVSSLAEAYGWSVDALWEHPDNAALREERPDPNVLQPGDVVVIPDRQPKSVAASTGRRHVFRRRDVPALLRLQFLDGQRPRANLPYRLVVGERTQNGTTDDRGVLKIFVPNGARSATLFLGPAEEEYQLDIGAMDPFGAPEGLAKRLANLGLLQSASATDEEIALALRQIQRWASLEETGAPDDATLAALASFHDSPERPKGPA